MKPYLKDNFGNPSSIHWFGRKARALIEEKRKTIAGFLNAEEEEIIFTSGGTESDNLAIKGIIDAFNKLSLNYNQPLAKSFLSHIITSSIEHHAVYYLIKELEQKKLAEVTYLPVNQDGLVNPEEVRKAIKPNTLLISIMYVNNEIGTIQPIREIGKIIEKENRKRFREKGNRAGNKKKEINQNPDFQQPFPQIYFHTDAVQATEYLPMNTKYLHVDLLTLSGHKIGGPKGIGALFVKKGTPIDPQILGGVQEGNKRAGTENVQGIIGLGKAVELISQPTHQKKIDKIRKLRDYFLKKVSQKIKGTMVNGTMKERSVNNLNFSFKGVEGEALLLSLDLSGVAASSGSACTSASLEPSHVIMAATASEVRAHSSVRFTLGEGTSKEEIDYTVAELIKIVARIRKVSQGIKI
jgi:cysteine desulfurase